MLPMPTDNMKEYVTFNSIFQVKSKDSGMYIGGKQDFNVDKIRMYLGSKFGAQEGMMPKEEGDS